MLKVEDLTFRYQNTLVLKEINFTIEDGDIVAILGANGAGKSTLLKCLNHILKSEEGTIKIDESNLALLKDKTKAQLISYVPQEIIFGDFTVFDAVLMGRTPYLRFELKEEDLMMTNQILERFHLLDDALKNVNTLSGGQKQKVAIARAIVQDAKIILFDEPTSNLDLKNQLEIGALIKKITTNDKITVVAMHDLNMAIRLANKFLFLKNHQVYAYGSSKIITAKLIKEVYDLDVEIVDFNQTKMIIPKEENNDEKN